MATTAQPSRRTPAQLAAEGFAALVERLGMADAIRYVQLYDPGRGDYTRDRPQWLDGLTHTEVASLMVQAEARHGQPEEVRPPE